MNHEDIRLLSADPPAQSPLMRLATLAIPLTLLATVSASASEGYLRQPDIHGETVVFAAEGDLWTVPAAGGTARRLTAHAGDEIAPRFSPDGKWIAFTAQYDGNADAYVVGTEGGEPRRLTWHPDRDLVIGWTPDGENVIFRSSREEPNGDNELYTIPAKGGDARKMPLGWAARIDIDAESGRYAFTRTNPEEATWKRYRGGLSTTIWVGDPKRGEFHPVTDFPGMNAFPMWHAGRIWFASDAGGTVNLWSMAPDGSDRRQHTTFDTWDMRFPAMGPDGRVVFVLAGEIHGFDPASGTERKISIDLPTDRVRTRMRYPEPAEYLSWFDLSPDGKRLLVTTRGEIFSVPVNGEGVTLPLTRGSGSRESWASFDDEGRRIVYVTDEKHEEEIRTLDAWGRGEPRVIRPPAESGWTFPPLLSPGGKWVAYSDHTYTLWVAPTDGGERRKVDHDPEAEITSYSFSPDGRWLAYARNSANHYASIYLYDTEAEKVHRVTGESTNDTSPAWDPEGRYLYFLGDRHMNPLLGARDLVSVDIQPTLPHLVLLREDVPNPFANGKGVAAGEHPKEEKAEEREEDDDEKRVTPLRIDLDGISDRIVEFPVDPGNYTALAADGEAVFWLSDPIEGLAEFEGYFSDPSPTSSIVRFDLGEQEQTLFLEGAAAFTLAEDASKMAVMKRRGELYVVDTGSPPEDLAGSEVALDDIVLQLDPREEWEQIYYETWRNMRDFYWDAALGGLDWKAERDRYATLLPRLSSHGDLQDLLGELVGELSTSHTYVIGGDAGGRAASVSTGLLGADLTREGGAFRIAKIYRADPADRELSPLVEPGVDVREGSYILQVNHGAIPADRPFESALEGLAGKQVLLTVNDRPQQEGAREVVVETLPSEQGLRHADWVRQNRERVAGKTEGKIGYLHLPDMGPEGLIEFNTWFYPQLDKEGLIVDVRWNNGGFVSEMILERLRRRVLAFNRTRGGGVGTYPHAVLNGPFVVLTNQRAGSDGDIFPTAVQLDGLAPVIGMRSWGGVVGIRAMRWLVDRGLVTHPESAWWDVRRGWGLENRGVEPDIVVENPPHDIARGIDAQLEKAIEEVLRLHAARPPVRPEFGPAAARGRKADL